LLEVSTLRALVGNLWIFVRIWIRILPVVQSADPHVCRSAFYP